MTIVPWKSVVCLGLVVLSAAGERIAAAEPAIAPARRDILRDENLAAWCIVPFDAKKRGPAERAAMLKELGLLRCAYDWRQEHVPTFEHEILVHRQFRRDVASQLIQSLVLRQSILRFRQQQRRCRFVD